MSAQMVNVVVNIASAGLMLAGAMTIKRGFWPRRRGDEPHCRRCGYTLVGNQSGTCPECGAMGSVVRGARRRSRRMGVGGVMILLLGVGIGSGKWLRGVD